MSLINQVLNDLEKRGASTDIGEATIRVVAYRRRNTLLWITLAMLSSIVLGASAWMKWGDERLPEAGAPEHAKPDVAAVAPVAPMAVSQPVAVQVLAASQVAAATAQHDKPVVEIMPALAQPAPVIEAVSPQLLHSKGRQQKLTLRGKHFAKDASVTLITPAGKELGKRRIVKQGEDKIVIRANLAGKSGEWHAEIINPDGKSSGRVSFVVQAAEAAIPDATLAPDAAVVSPAKAAAESSQLVAEQRAAGIDKQIVKLPPYQQADIEYRKAYDLLRQGNAAAALGGFEAALQLEAGHVAARQALVRLLLDSKRQDEAVKVLQEGVQHDPKQTVFALMLARIQAGRNDLTGALETVKLSLPYAQQQAEYQAYAAAIYQRLNRHEEAIEHYRTALQLKPNAGVWLMGLGISLRATQHNEEARAAFRQALDSGALSADLRAYVTQQLKEL